MGGKGQGERYAYRKSESVNDVNFNATDSMGGKFKTRVLRRAPG